MAVPEPTGLLKLRAGATLWQEIDQETIVLDPLGARYLGVNEAGSTIWSALSRGTTHSELVRLLHGEFDVPLDQVGADVTRFIHQCRHLGFLVDE